MTITSINYLCNVRAALAAIDHDQLDHIVDLIETAKLILTCGNGGSAATAMHFASDLRSLGLSAFDLLSAPKITQIGNDCGYVNVFLMQANMLDALVIAFSCSGTSQNMQALAFESCERMVLFSSELHTLEYPGVYEVRVDSADYEVIEDVHLAMCHAIKKELKVRGR